MAKVKDDLPAAGAEWIDLDWRVIQWCKGFMVKLGRNRNVALAAGLFAACWGLQIEARSARARTTVIGDVTLISPERPVPLGHAWVKIANGRISDVSTQPLTGDANVDGHGLFLIPGLIDTHVHLGSVPGMQAPQRASHPDLVALAAAQEPRSYLYFASPPYCRSAIRRRPSAAGTRSMCGRTLISAAARQS